MPYSFVRYNFPSCITAFNPISLITQIKYLSENQTASRKRSFYWGTKALLLLLLFLLLTGPIFVLETVKVADVYFSILYDFCKPVIIHPI
jgi:hypothetical protein